MMIYRCWKRAWSWEFAWLMMSWRSYFIIIHIAIWPVDQGSFADRRSLWPAVWTILLESIFSKYTDDERKENIQKRCIVIRWRMLVNIHFKSLGGEMEDENICWLLLRSVREMFSSPCHSHRFLSAARLALHISHWADNDTFERL
jgi:hypothetical protein